MSARYVSLATAAEYLEMTEAGVRKFIAEGRLTGYRVGKRSIRVDLHEVDALLVPIPAANAGGAR
jgi:excisionase family DNA binding protein